MDGGVGTRRVETPRYYWSLTLFKNVRRGPLPTRHFGYESPGCVLVLLLFSYLLLFTFRLTTTRPGSQGSTSKVTRENYQYIKTLKRVLILLACRRRVFRRWDEGPSRVVLWVFPNKVVTFPIGPLVSRPSRYPHYVHLRTFSHTDKDGWENVLTRRYTETTYT